MLHYSFNSIFEQVFVTGYQASLQNPSHIIHISYNVNGSLCVVQHNSPSLLYLWSGYASDFWPFLSKRCLWFLTLPDKYICFTLTHIGSQLPLVYWVILKVSPDWIFNLFLKFFDNTILYCLLSILFGLTYLYILNSAIDV